MPTLNEKPSSVLVISGGIAGIQVALDLCDMGLYVNLVERALRMGIHAQLLWHVYSDLNIVEQQGW